MQSSRQYTFIQNYRHAKSRKYKANKNYIWDAWDVELKV